MIVTLALNGCVGWLKQDGEVKIRETLLRIILICLRNKLKIKTFREEESRETTEKFGIVIIIRIGRKEEKLTKQISARIIKNWVAVSTRKGEKDVELKRERNCCGISVDYFLWREGEISSAEKKEFKLHHMWMKRK